MAQQSVPGRVANAEALHLTLAFLGEVPAPRLTDAIAAARRVEPQACVLHLDRARYWPRQRIVCAEPRETPLALAGLARELAEELEAEGFRLEPRPFRAHLTLMRSVRGAHALPDLPPRAWPVHEFILVHSNLERGAARYEVMARFGG